MQCDLIASIDKDTVLPTAPLTLPHYLVSWGALHGLRSATRFRTDAESSTSALSSSPGHKPPDLGRQEHREPARLARANVRVLGLDQQD